MAQNQLSFSTQPGVSSSSCGFALTGTLKIPSSAGSGGFGAAWTPYSSFKAGDTCLLVYPEGGVCGFQAGSAITIGTDLGQVSVCPTPDTPAGSTWQKQTSDEDGVKMKPFKLFRCAEQMTSDFVHFPDQNTNNTSQLVKVFHDSQLTGAFTSPEAGGLYIFGLDTPFILNPGEIVYLEVVFNTTNTGEITPLYAAIGHGIGWDFDAVDGLGSTIPVVGKQAPSPTKVVTAAQASALYGFNTYVAQSVNQYVGLSTYEADWLLSQQQAALTALAAYTDSIPRQFKAWKVIGRARGASPSTSTYVTPGNMVLGPVDQSFVIDQFLSSHLELVLRNNNNTPVLVPTVSSEVNASKTKLPTPIVKNIQHIGPTIYNVYLGFATGEYPLAPNLPNEQFESNQLNQLGGGLTSLDARIYYTTDGTVPTVNTIKNTNCHVFNPHNGLLVNTSGLIVGADIQSAVYAVTHAIQWFAVNQAFDCSEVGVLAITDIHT